MRILWLLPNLPYPPDTGGKQDTFFMLREFSRMGHEIDTGIIFHAGKPPNVPEEFGGLVKQIHFLPGNPKALHARLFSSLSDPVPFKFRKYHSEEAVRKVADILAEGSFDAVIVDHQHLAQVLFDTRSIVTWEGSRFPLKVLRTQNVESTIVRKYSERVDNPMVKAFAGKEARKMKEYEANMLSEFDLVAAISPVDQAVFEKMSGLANVISVTAGIDVEEHRPLEAPPIDGEVVYVGTFDWQPNVDAALWLVDKVWPKVIERVPDAHLSLVGKKPPPPLESKACKNITVTGWVESVVQYVGRSCCSVVPLWIGSGMRLKILEAFALGRAVVSTTLGAEGIEAVDGEHILIRDEPGEFADAVVEMLTDPARRDEIGRKARALAVEKYSWPGVAKYFSDEVEKLIASRSD